MAELYEHAVAAFQGSGVLWWKRTRSSLSFEHNFDGSRKVILNLIPGESDSDKGLFFRIYRDRFAELAGISSDEVEGLMPASHRDWSYIANSDPEWEGFEGFMAGSEEIDRLAGSLSQAAA